MALRIDVHTHLYPKYYMDICLKYSKSPKIIKIDEYKYRMVEGDTIMGHHDLREAFEPDARAEIIPKLGLDAQIISVTIPGAERFDDKSLTVEVQELINNELAAVCRNIPR